MEFNFREMQKKYAKKSKGEEEQDALSRIVLNEDFQVNPAVVQHCEQIQRDFVKYHNNNRYFYLHQDQAQLDHIEKLKNDEFHKIRKEYQVTLLNNTVKQVLPLAKAQKKPTKTEKEAKFKHYAYLFRKNIKIIIKKLKIKKITISDIFHYELLTDKPYRFGKNIFQAVKEGEDTKLWRYYIENKFVVYSVDTTMKTPLVWACIRGYAHIAKMLIEMGVLLNKKDILGHSALYYAIHYKQQECLKLLLLHESEISPEDIEQSTKEKRIKNIVDLCRSIIIIIRKMPFEKRSEIFEARLKHLH